MPLNVLSIKSNNKLIAEINWNVINPSKCDSSNAATGMLEKYSNFNVPSVLKWVSFGNTTEPMCSLSCTAPMPDNNLLVGSNEKIYFQTVDDRTLKLRNFLKTEIESLPLWLGIIMILFDSLKHGWIYELLIVDKMSRCHDKTRQTKLYFKIVNPNLLPIANDSMASSWHTKNSVAKSWGRGDWSAKKKVEYGEGTGQKTVSGCVNLSTIIPSLLEW